MSINRLYITFLFLAFASISWSQTDHDFVHWQKSIGGAGEDHLNDMVKDTENNIYVVGSTQTDGSQSMDIRISKYSFGGTEIWSRTIGEAGDDRGVAIELVNQELFVVASSTSSSGIFSQNSGRADIYLIRMNLDGTVIGTTHFGGNFSDVPTDISKTKNGELLISGQSQSTSGDFASNYGQSDMWVFRVGSDGNLIWQKNYGGSDEDFTSKIAELPNGEIMLFGHTASFDGDIGLNYGDFDLSLLRLTSTGNVIWEKNYGGQQSEIGVDLLIKEDGTIILAGNTLSQSFDIAKNAGFSDAWVLEVDPSNGAIIWEETHGSEFGDYASALAMNAQNELFLMGTTNASVFYNEQSQGNDDAWLAKVNSPESIDHVALFGGNGFETISGFSFENEGSILLYGSSTSTDLFFSSNSGKSDGWLMKVVLGSNENNFSQVAVSAHPNPTNGIVYLNNLSETDEIRVVNSMGQIVVEQHSAMASSQILDLSTLNTGVYLVQIQRESRIELLRLVRN